MQKILGVAPIPPGRARVKFGELKLFSGARRAFCSHFYLTHHRNAPERLLFRRLFRRFETAAFLRAVHHHTPQNPTPDPAGARKGMSFAKVWTILRKKLHWKPYRPCLSTTLSKQYGIQTHRVYVLAETIFFCDF